MNRRALIDGAYNNRIRTFEPPPDTLSIFDSKSREVTIKLLEPSRFVTVFINNFCLNEKARWRMGNSLLLVGNDPPPWSNKNLVAVDPIYDGGFFEVELSEPA